jgi:hypothetical protein
VPLPGVALATSHVNAEMSRFVMPESLRGLGLDDRPVYLTMIGALNVFVSISGRPSPIQTRVQRCGVSEVLPACRYVADK